MFLRAINTETLKQCQTLTLLVITLILTFFVPS